MNNVKLPESLKKAGKEVEGIAREIGRIIRRLIRILILCIVLAILWLLAEKKLPQLEVLAPAITELAEFILMTANAGAKWILQLVK